MQIKSPVRAGEDGVKLNLFVHAHMTFNTIPIKYTSKLLFYVYFPSFSLLLWDSQRRSCNENRSCASCRSINDRLVFSNPKANRSNLIKLK